MQMNFNDAVQANLGFVTSQTSHIEAGVYRIKYPDVDYASLIPVDTSAGEWSKSVTFYSMDAAGRADWINGNGKDIPVVGVGMEKFESAVYTAGIGYSYGFEEVNQARMLGISLDAEKASAARRAYEEMIYRIAFNGDSAKSFQGLFNYSGVPAASVAADGTGASTLWANKTPDLILRDINALLTGIHTSTNTVEMADTLILPIERFMLLSSQRLGDTAMTTLEFLRQSNVYTATTGQALTIRGMRGLTTQGAGNTARMIAYRRSPEVLKLHIPMPHRFLPVQVEGLQFTVPGVFRLGGLDIRLPRAVSYGDGI
ncbi:MAG: DUF2184 domain-containing protein [Fuscovulum sp.]|nr:MAG: DUF2184 domain-containing protein [Fuscovulum sp.]